MSDLIKYFKDYIDSINEGLIRTYPADIVLKNILSELRLLNLNVNGNLNDDKIILTIEDFNLIPLNQIENIFDIITIHCINRGGWFPSKMKIIRLSLIQRDFKYSFRDIMINHDEIKSISISYEKNFDKKDTDVPDKLYHLSIRQYNKKILNKGLFPKSKSKLTSHLDRIYLCKSINDCLELIPKMKYYYNTEFDDNYYKYGKKGYKKDIEPVIYEIDNSDGFIRFLYKDPNYENGNYILKNIDKKRIKLVK